MKNTFTSPNVLALRCENETAEMLLQLRDVRGLPLPVGLQITMIKQPSFL